MGVDNAIHFFQFPGGNKNPAELVIEDPDGKQFLFDIF